MTDLIAFIERNWGFNGVHIEKTLQERGERKVFLISTNNGSYILKLFHPELTYDLIEKYTKVLVFLEQQGYRQAPRLIRSSDNSVYKRIGKQYLYLMEHIEGTAVDETPDNLHALGIASALLHRIEGYDEQSCLNTTERKMSMLARFGEFQFKPKYDEIVKGLPDFEKLRQGFIHTDIHPGNAIKRPNGEIVFIDFDDAGNGSIIIDSGYPLITQFIQFEGRTQEHGIPDINKLYFRFDEAKAFYDGYFSVNLLTNEEKQWVFDGAVFMQLMYMPAYGGGAVPYLWRMIEYAFENKKTLLEALGVVNK